MRDRLCSCGTRADIRQLTTGFPKKLLVAVSVVVIIAMCLRPAEAASLRRRRLHDSMPNETKDKGASRSDGPHHKRRHQGLKIVTQITKDLEETDLPIDVYEIARNKIESKIEYTIEHLELNRKALKARQEGDYGSGMPPWLPKNNFVDIHFQKYGNKSEEMKSKLNFVLLTQKMYKSLLEYHELFKHFNKVKDLTLDYKATRYDEERHMIFTQTTHELFSAIGDLKDAMKSVNMTVNFAEMELEATKMKLDSIELRMNTVKFMKNDDILLRAYKNLLTNWYLEFSCSKFKMSKSTKVLPETCRQYKESLKGKRDKRKRNRNKQKPLKNSSKKLKHSNKQQKSLRKTKKNSS